MKKYHIFLLLFIIVTGCLRPDDTEVYFLREVQQDELEDYISILSDTTNSAFDLVLVDLSDKESYDQGHLPFAEHLQLDLLVDTNGYLVNDAKALTGRYVKDRTLLFHIFSQDTAEYMVAKLAQRLEYTEVYYYEGSRENWQDEGNYLWINYTAFKSWHNTHFPFEDTTKWLVDIHPSDWYQGEAILNGHIPGAVNIPAESLIDYQSDDFTLLDEGRALTQTIKNPDATIVLYDTNDSYQLSLDFLKAAKQLGYKRLFLFRDGYSTWVSNAQPLNTE